MVDISADLVSAFIPDLLPSPLPIPSSRSSSRYLRSRQILLQETIVDEILGPENENIPRIQQWVRTMFQTEPKIASQILTRVLPSPVQLEENALRADSSVNNTLVIIDQATQNSILPGFALPSPKESIKSKFRIPRYAPLK